MSYLCGQDAALTRSEHAVTGQITTAYEPVAGLLGYRLRPELGAIFETMATVLNATMRGLLLMARHPGPRGAPHRARPFGTAAAAECSQPALAIATIALGFLEPDPAIEWTEERLTEVRQALKSPDWPGT